MLVIYPQINADRQANMLLSRLHWKNWQHTLCNALSHSLLLLLLHCRGGKLAALQLAGGYGVTPVAAYLVDPSKTAMHSCQVNCRVPMYMADHVCMCITWQPVIFSQLSYQHRTHI
jgi:hypothetical protein